MMKACINEHTVKKISPRLYSHYYEVKCSTPIAILFGNFLITKESEKEIFNLTLIEVIASDDINEIITKIHFESNSINSMRLISDMINE